MNPIKRPKGQNFDLLYTELQNFCSAKDARLICDSERLRKFIYNMTFVLNECLFEDALPLHESGKNERISAHFKEVSCVYALFFFNAQSYFGKTTNLRQTVYRHKSTWPSEIWGIAYKNRDVSELDAEERDSIATANSVGLEVRNDKFSSLTYRKQEAYLIDLELSGALSLMDLKKTLPVLFKMLDARKLYGLPKL